MLNIYTIPVSLYCAKLRILLRHKGLEWREIPPPGGYGSDEYKEYIPSGNLPALRDGFMTISDSEAIAEYLNEKHPEPPMLPVDLVLRAKARERSRFHDTRFEPALRVLFAQIDPATRDRAVVEAQSQVICDRLKQFARSLNETRPQLDDILTLGDCGFPISFAWIDELTPTLNLKIEWPAAIPYYRDLIASHAAVETELADYSPKLAAYLADRTGG